MTRGILLAVALGAFALANAQPRTFVKLAGKDDSVPKLGLPGITVEVVGPRVEESEVVRAEIARALALTAHTRTLAAEEPGDYALVVTLAGALDTPGAASIPFEANLSAADGRKLWRVEGHTDLDATAAEPPALISLGRNVVSALVHDGWVAPKYDPENPPPAPPTIRRYGSPSPS